MEEHVERGNSPEFENRRALEALPAALGYVETDEMIVLRGELVAAMTAGEDTRERALQYRLLADEVSDRSEIDPSSRVRLGKLISIAIMRRDGGQYDEYIEDLEDALIIAEQEGFEDAALVLNSILNKS